MFIPTITWHRDHRIDKIHKIRAAPALGLGRFFSSQIFPLPEVPAPVPGVGQSLGWLLIQLSLEELEKDIPEGVTSTVSHLAGGDSHSSQGKFLREEQGGNLCWIHLFYFYLFPFRKPHWFFHFPFQQSFRSSFPFTFLPPEGWQRSDFFFLAAPGVNSGLFDFEGTLCQRSTTSPHPDPYFSFSSKLMPPAAVWAGNNLVWGWWCLLFLTHSIPPGENPCVTPEKFERGKTAVNDTNKCPQKYFLKKPVISSLSFWELALLPEQGVGKLFPSFSIKLQGSHGMQVTFESLRGVILKPERQNLIQVFLKSWNGWGLEGSLKIILFHPLP